MPKTGDFAAGKSRQSALLKPEARSPKPERTVRRAVSEEIMSVDAETVRRIARLARIAVAEDEVEHLQGELNTMLAFVEQLSEVDVAGVEPMTSVMPMAMKSRVDEVTDGGNGVAVLSNAPASEDGFYLVPKVIE
jgi:aspartyl-tRNA(Asn)/glutamyl-tRNA(Gln) amidotransferase subunit C